MATQDFSKVQAKFAAEVCAHYQLENRLRPLLAEGASPRDFVSALIAHRQYLPAIDFLAHALPPREAIWWGCLCLQHACGDTLSPTEKAACKAAVLWLIQPSEETRAFAKAPGDLAGYASPAGALAIAANQTGGSLGPPNYPPVPPPPYAPAKAVAQAVKCASLKGESHRMAERQRCYSELGIAVAEGKYV